MELGEQIATLREEQALTQVELAEAARISPSTLSQIESGKVPSPHVGTVRKIARALGVEPAELRRTKELTLSGKAKAPIPGPTEEQRRFDEAPALPEVQDWVRGLGPEAALLAMDDDEFYGHAESAIGGDPFKVKPILDRLERGRDAIEDALKGSTEDMPEALHPNEPASGPKDRVYAAVRRRQPRRRVAQWARARAHVRARNLCRYVLERTAAMPNEAQVEQLVEETAGKQT